MMDDIVRRESSWPALIAQPQPGADSFYPQ
jgi:hypothetical protein